MCTYACGGETNSGKDASADSGTLGDTGTMDEGGVCPPSPSCAVDDNTLVLAFADHPELQNVNGSALVEDPRFKDPVCGQDFVMVARAASGFVAVAGSCTHSCCTVSFNKTAQRFDCPCHGSRFSLAGKVQLGPASTALKSLTVCADDCAVYVQLK